MRSWTLPLLLAVAALPSLAHADQCQLIDDEVANRALAALKGHPKVIQFCEPCGDKTPVPTHGWFAACKDSEGNAFHLWQNDASAA